MSNSTLIGLRRFRQVGAMHSVMTVNWAPVQGWNAMLVPSSSTSLSACTPPSAIVPLASPRRFQEISAGLLRAGPRVSATWLWL
jgi:hypothetical protein